MKALVTRVIGVLLVTHLIFLCKAQVLDNNRWSLGGIRSETFQIIPNCATGYYSKTGVLLQQIYSKSLTSCGMECLKSSKCQAFNFYIGANPTAKQILCELYSARAIKCSDLVPLSDWTYMRIPPESDTGNVETTPKSSSSEEANCKSCTEEHCPQWEEAYSVSANGEMTGNIECFKNAVFNGANVMISYALDFKSSIVTRSPIEIVYDSDTFDINFYFAPRHIYSGNDHVKEYLALSLSGFYRRSTYTVDNTALYLNSSPMSWWMAKFFIRYSYCNLQGDLEGYSINPSDSSPKTSSGDLSRLFLRLSSGALPTVHTTRVNALPTEGFQARWVIFSNDLHINAAVLKPNGESFKNEPTPLEVNDPLKSEYVMVDASGTKTSLKLGLTSSSPSVRTSVPADQSWFYDSCWKESYRAGDSSLDNLRRTILQGQSVRITFKIGSVSYFASAPAVFCNYRSCGGLLEKIPELNTSNNIEFVWDNTAPHVKVQTYQFDGSYIITAYLGSTKEKLQKVNLRWYVDSNVYQPIYMRTANSYESLDELSDYLTLGTNLRLIYTYQSIIHSYEIDYVIFKSSDSFELHTVNLPDRYYATNDCGDGRAVNYEIVLTNRPFSFRRYGWSWNYMRECRNEDLSTFSSVYVFAPVELTAGIQSESTG